MVKQLILLQEKFTIIKKIKISRLEEKKWAEKHVKSLSYGHSKSTRLLRAANYQARIDMQNFWKTFWDA